MKIKIALEENHFRDLVAGKELSIEVPTFDGGAPITAKIILRDIGFDRMAAAISDAIKGAR